MPRPLTKAERESIIALSETGLNPTDIHRKTGFTRRSIYFWLRRWRTARSLESLKRKNYERATTAEEDATIIAKHSADPFLSTSITSSTYKVSQETIRRRLKKAGIKCVRLKKTETLEGWLEEKGSSSPEKEGASLQDEDEVGATTCEKGSSSSEKEDAKIQDKDEVGADACEEVCPSSETVDASLQDEDEVGATLCAFCLININNEDEFQLVCLQCADVFLCKACFDDGQHAHHYMLRIPKDKPPDEVSRVVSRLRTELTTENNSQEQAVPEVKQDVPELEHDVPQLEPVEPDMSEQEQTVPEQEHDISEQEQIVPKEENEHCPEPNPLEEDEVNVDVKKDLEPDPLTVNGDTQNTIKEESDEDEMDRRRVEQRAEQVVDSTHTTTATHSHTKRAPSGDSEAGPSKVARSTGTGPHNTRASARLVAGKTYTSLVTSPLLVQLLLGQTHPSKTS